MALKLDTSKAYDHVEWSFLESMMRTMGFPGRCISLIMRCVKYISYSIMINGKRCGHITPTRGIRQGDPLSSYLFLLCAEGFFALLNKAATEKRIQRVSTSRRGPKITHLFFFFADDSLLFCKVQRRDCMEILNILQKYEQASGQKANMKKSALYFSSNTKAEDKGMIRQLFNV